MLSGNYIGPELVGNGNGKPKDFYHYEQVNENTTNIHKLSSK